MFDKDYDRVTIVYASQTEHGEKMSYTENLADFGHRERVMMEEILRLWNKSCLPEGQNFQGPEQAPPPPFLKREKGRAECACLLMKLQGLMHKLDFFITYFVLVECYCM